MGRIKGRSKLDPFKQEIIDSYVAGEPTTTLGKKYKTTSKNMWDFLKRHGVEIRDRHVYKNNLNSFWLSGEENVSKRPDVRAKLGALDNQVVAKLSTMVFIPAA